MSNSPFYREPSYEREARLREKREEKALLIKVIVGKLNSIYEYAEARDLLEEVLPENGNTIGELLAMNIDELNAYAEQLKGGDV